MKALNKKVIYYGFAAFALLIIIIAVFSLQNRQIVENRLWLGSGGTELYVKSISRPQGLAMDRNGKLFTQSSYDGKISIINKDGKAFDYTYLDNYIGYGIEIDKYDNILMASDDKVIRVDTFGRMIQDYVGFKRAYDVEIAPDDTIFVSDSEENKIYKISPLGDISEFVAFENRKSSSILNVAGISFDKDFKNLYCVNMYSGDLYKISVEKDLQAGKPEIIASGLDRPAFIDIDAEGNAYISCQGSNTVVRVDQNSIVENIDTGGKLAAPCGIVVDSSNGGLVYVASKDTNSIYKINIDIKNKDKK